MIVKPYPYNTHKQFKVLEGINRPISLAHVDEMMESVKKNGVIRPIVVAKISFIDGKSTDYIVDGQHLFTGLIREKMDIPVTYVTRKIDTYEELVDLISKLNVTSKNWTLADYVNIWASTGKRSYKKLKIYQQEYKLPFSTLCMALNSDSLLNATSRMKEGKFQINDEGFAVTMLNNLRDIFRVMPRGFRSEQKVLVTAYIQWFKENRTTYRHRAFINALHVHRTRVTASLRSVPECKQTLEEVLLQKNAKPLTVVSVGSLKTAQ